MKQLSLLVTIVSLQVNIIDGGDCKNCEQYNDDPIKCEQETLVNKCGGYAFDGKCVGCITDKDDIKKYQTENACNQRVAHMVKMRKTAHLMYQAMREQHRDCTRWDGDDVGWSVPNELLQQQPNEQIQQQPMHQGVLLQQQKKHTVVEDTAYHVIFQSGPVINDELYYYNGRNLDDKALYRKINQAQYQQIILGIKDQIQLLPITIQYDDEQVVQNFEHGTPTVYKNPPKELILYLKKEAQSSQRPPIFDNQLVNRPDIWEDEGGLVVSIGNQQKQKPKPQGPAIHEVTPDHCAMTSAIEIVEHVVGHEAIADWDKKLWNTRAQQLSKIWGEALSTPTKGFFSGGGGGGGFLSPFVQVIYPYICTYIYSYIICEIACTGNAENRWVKFCV